MDIQPCAPNQCVGGNYGAVAFCNLGDGRGVWVMQQIYNAKIVIGPIGSRSFDDDWCYRNAKEAVRAAQQWNPATQLEPEGWFRNRKTARRRIDGDPKHEYIQP